MIHFIGGFFISTANSVSTEDMHGRVKQTVRLHADCTLGMQAAALDSIRMSAHLTDLECNEIAILAERYHPYMQKFTYSKEGKRFEACAP